MLQQFKDKLKELEENLPKFTTYLATVRQHTSQVSYIDIQAEVESLYEDAKVTHAYDCKCLRVAIADAERETHIEHAEELINPSIDWDDDIPF